MIRWFEDASEEVPGLALDVQHIQKPVIAAPNGTGFPVAMLDAADQARIPLASVKPELLHVSCHDADDEDPLGLAAAVREQMREIGHPIVQGRHIEAPVVYLDDAFDGVALLPKIIYTVSGTTVSLRLRLEQGDKIIKEEKLNLSLLDKKALVDRVVAKLVAMATDAQKIAVSP